MTTRWVALVLAAASEVVGASLASDVLRLPKERPRRARRASRGWDFACHAPATMFHRLVALAAANASRDERPARASVDALDAAMAPGDVRAEVDAAIARERASDPDPNREGEGGGASWTARVGRAVCRVSGFPEFTVWGRPPAGSLPSAGALL